MVRRSTRHYSDAAKVEMLAVLKECRNACIRARMEAPIGCEVYKGADSLMIAIDDMAGVLTGNRTLFHLAPHSTHGGPCN